jgi:hypothetical protein
MIKSTSKSKLAATESADASPEPRLDETSTLKSRHDTRHSQTLHLNINRGSLNMAAKRLVKGQRSNESLRRRQPSTNSGGSRSGSPSRSKQRSNSNSKRSKYRKKVSIFGQADKIASSVDGGDGKMPNFDLATGRRSPALGKKAGAGERSIVVKQAKSKGSLNIESIDVHDSSIFSANIASTEGLGPDGSRYVSRGHLIRAELQQ